jgi:hypothetical protein
MHPRGLRIVVLNPELRERECGSKSPRFPAAKTRTAFKAHHGLRARQPLKLSLSPWPSFEPLTKAHPRASTVFIDELYAAGFERAPNDFKS